MESKKSLTLRGMRVIDCSACLVFRKLYGVPLPPASERAVDGAFR